MLLILFAMSSSSSLQFIVVVAVSIASDINFLYVTAAAETYELRQYARTTLAREHRIVCLAGQNGAVETNVIDEIKNGYYAIKVADSDLSGDLVQDWPHLMKQCSGLYQHQYQQTTTTTTTRRLARSIKAPERI